jgi:hypothetical protein
MMGNFLFQRAVARQKRDRIVLRTAKPKPFAVGIGFLSGLDLENDTP